MTKKIFIFCWVVYKYDERKNGLGVSWINNLKEEEEKGGGGGGKWKQGAIKEIYSNCMDVSNENVLECG